MQISYKPVVQACDDFEILMHTSKESKKVSSFYLFSLGYWGKLSETFIRQQGKEIFTIGLAYLEQSPSSVYKLDQVCIDDAQKNYLWWEDRLSFLHLKKYWGYHLFMLFE